MSEGSLTEQLDQAIDVMLRERQVSPMLVDHQIAELINVAAELRDLPRTEFKARLRAELENEVSMSIENESVEVGDQSSESEKQTQSPQIRAGFRTVTPYVVVPDVHQEIDFIKKVFGAEGKVYGLGSQGGFHSEYRIGDSMLMIGGGGKGAHWQGTPAPAAMHVYVEDVDGVYQRAVDAGATSLYAPMDQPYGDRDAAVADSQGNHWYLATHPGGGPPEGAPKLMPHLHPKGAPQLIDFLKQAFGAEEGLVHRSPDGVVHYARMSIGDSVIEMGEAHEQWQPMPMHFMLYVDDADEWYARAMKAEGAISIGAPANAPYGGRTGTIKDPFGNTWYLSSQVQKKDESEPRRT